MASREIITLQFGHFSNFVGTHFWNIQEEARTKSQEINHGPLFRSADMGRAQRPRLLAFDLKGSLGSLSTEAFVDKTVHNFYYDDFASSSEERNQAGLWQGQVSQFVPEPRQVDFLKYIKEQTDEEDQQSEKEKEKKEKEAKMKKRKQMEETVGVWSDFLSVPLHPKSIYEIQEYTHDVDAFNVWPDGESLFSTTEKREEIMDRLRFFTEECGALQGFQCFADLDTGFGGFVRDFLEELRNDFPKAPVIMFGSSTSRQNMRNADKEKRFVNMALSLRWLSGKDSKLTSILVPAQPHQWKNFRNISLDFNNSYHTSAIVAEAIDTATLPYRLCRSSREMYAMVGDLVIDPRAKISSLSVSLPLPVPENTSLKEFLASRPTSLLEAPFLNNLSFSHTLPSDPLAESVVVRGFPVTSSSERALVQYLQKHRCLRRQMEVVETPFIVSAAYPDFFNSNVGIEGQVNSSTAVAIGESVRSRVQSVPTMTHLQTTTGIFPALNEFVKNATHTSKDQLRTYLNAGMSWDDWQETCDQLLYLAETYKDE